MTNLLSGSYNEFMRYFLLCFQKKKKKKILCKSKKSVLSLQVNTQFTSEPPAVRSPPYLLINAVISTLT